MNNSEIERPNFFSKPAIWGFSVLLSPFFGAILFAQNLNEIGKKNEIFKVILFSIAWNIAMRLCTRMFNDFLYTFLIANALGGLILIFPIWNYYFKEIIDYKRRNIYGPAIVVTVIIAFLITLILVTRH